MATAKPNSARERIRHLQGRFLKQLPEQIHRMRGLLHGISDDLPHGQQESARELHRLLHSIKGTGRSFGYPELGSIANYGEAILGHLLDQEAEMPDDQWRPQLQDCIDRLALNSEQLCSSAEPGDTQALPEFELPMPHSGHNPADNDHRRIYLCDDDELFLEQTAAQLSCFGYQMECFNEPESLRLAILQHAPAAIILDIGFPGDASAGIRVMERIRADIGYLPPTVFLSAREDFEARLQAAQAGGEAYFHKPTPAMELVNALDQLVLQQEHEPYRVLVIDDQPEIAAYHSIILQAAGMLTHYAEKPEMAFRALQEFRPDMVLTDMYMPECSGRDLAKLIRQVPEYIGLPIVYLSGETDRQKQFSAMRVVADGFMTKPVIPEELVSAVSIRAERMRTLRSLMAKDSLTGLFNHTTTTQLLGNALLSAQRHRTSLSFVMIDIDRFKAVNDTHGHPVGDQVILALARVLQQRLRHSDLIGRYGGEEFAVILEDVDPTQAQQLIDDLREDFSQVRFHSPKGDFQCTFSAGIAGFPNHQHLDHLREAADKALYRAKSSGRNRVCQDTGNPADE
jgi:diguanylate cyclase (GGDEF)-like protein